jgi:BMFP domain-containing protein YqiC
VLDKIPFQDISRRLTEVASVDLLQGKENLEKNFRAILQGAFESMNLVSREEFEVQKAVLASTRERLEQLEVRLSALEQEQQPDIEAGS